MMILPLHKIIPANKSRLELVSDNARSPINAQSFAKRPTIDKTKTSSRWIITEAPRREQASSSNMPTLTNSRDETFAKNDSDVEKKIALRAQPIRIPVRQNSRKDIHEHVSPEQRKTAVGDKAPVSPVRIPAGQFGVNQHEKCRRLRIPTRQISQKRATNEPEQMIKKERRHCCKTSQKTTELLSQVLAGFSLAN